MRTDLQRKYAAKSGADPAVNAKVKRTLSFTLNYYFIIWKFRRGGIDWRIVFVYEKNNSLP